MYVYRPCNDGDIQYVVGFFDPSGKWIAESDHTTLESAASRVHYLNGGK